MALPIHPVLIDRNGVHQVLNRLPPPDYDHGPIAVETGQYDPTDIEAEQIGEGFRYQIYVAANATVFPKVQRTILTRDIQSHHALLDLFEKFDSIKEHKRLSSAPISIG